MTTGIGAAHNQWAASRIYPLRNGQFDRARQQHLICSVARCQRFNDTHMKCISFTELAGELHGLLNRFVQNRVFVLTCRCHYTTTAVVHNLVSLIFFAAPRSASSLGNTLCVGKRVRIGGILAAMRTQPASKTATKRSQPM